MNDILKECLIIDIASIRGSEEEIQLLKISDEIKQFDDFMSEDSSKLTKIVISMINKIQSSKNSCWIILFFSSKTRFYEELNGKMNLFKIWNSVILLIGLQSLFYFLGCNWKEFSSLKWISKEQMFFSQEFMNTARKFDNFINWRVYSLNQFDIAIKKFNWS